MSDLDTELQGPSFPEEENEAGVNDPPAGSGGGDDPGINRNYIHVRVQQRNGRKSLTTVQGLNAELSYKKVLKAVKKQFCCNGTVVDDPELGQVIQLQGDHRQNVLSFLTEEGISKKELIKVHGF